MKEQIIEFLRSEKLKKTDIDELKLVLNVSSSREFKVMIKSVNELLEQAVIIENSNHEITLIEHTNFMVGRLDLKDRGFGFVIPEDPSLSDVFIPRDYVKDAMNRDKVLVHVTKKKSGFRQEGQIKRILDRNYTHVIGVMEYRNGMGYLIPDDKTIKQQVIIKRDNQNGAKKFDVVRAEIINYSFKGKIECVVSEILGNKNDAGVDVLS